MRPQNPCRLAESRPHESPGPGRLATALRQLLDEMTSLPESTPGTISAESGALLWSDDDYVYFEIERPDHPRFEADLCVAGDRVMVRIARGPLASDAVPEGRPRPLSN